MAGPETPAHEPSGPRGGATAVIGLQWGDEGKGKLVDLLAPRYDAVVRFNGGANAGHSVVVGGERYALHLVPCGVLFPDVRAVIASGVVLDPGSLIDEMDALSARGVDLSRLAISDRAHVVMPYHKAEDELRERLLTGESGDDAIGTTRRGIGPAYADKAQRATSIRVADLLDPGSLRTKLELICRVKRETLRGLDDATLDPVLLAAQLAPLAERLRPHVCDTAYLLSDMIDDGQRVLFEGANAALLDVDHGTYPYVTSSSTTSLGAPSGAGVPCRELHDVLGVVKAYSTRVGRGPMPTELDGPIADGIRDRGREFGTTTGRPRRVGWLDLVAVRYTARITGATRLAMTLLDVLSGEDELRVCVAYDTPGGRTERFQPDARKLAEAKPIYQTLDGFDGDLTAARRPEDLPEAASAYVAFCERFIGVPIEVVGVGPGREQALTRPGAEANPSPASA